MLCFVESELCGYYTQLIVIGNWKYKIWVLNIFGLPFWWSVISCWELQMSNQRFYRWISKLGIYLRLLQSLGREFANTLQNFFDRGFTFSDCFVRTFLSGNIHWIPKQIHRQEGPCWLLPSVVFLWVDTSNRTKKSSCKSGHYCLWFGYYICHPFKMKSKFFHPVLCFCYVYSVIFIKILIKIILCI